MTGMKKEIIITDTKNNVYRYIDAKAVVDNNGMLIKVTFKYSDEAIYFPIVNILNIQVKEY